MNEQALETKNFIENQEEKERELLKMIAEADAERLKQKKEFDQVGISKLAFKHTAFCSLICPVYC